MFKPIQRIVTGHNAAGRSMILFNSLVRPWEDYKDLWVTERTPASNAGHADAVEHRPTKFEPPPLGSAFRIVCIPPEAEMAALSAEEREGRIARLFEQLGGSHTRVDTTRSVGMHKTRTVDYVIVLSGEITLLLDEGEVNLTPFDVVVQRGTNHNWINRGTEPALLGVALIDAEPI